MLLTLQRLYKHTASHPKVVVNRSKSIIRIMFTFSVAKATILIALVQAGVHMEQSTQFNSEGHTSLYYIYNIFVISITKLDSVI